MEVTLRTQEDELVLDMTQATPGTAGAAGTRAYLYQGAGLGEMYGQWQIDVKLGNNYGSSDVRPH